MICMMLELTSVSLHEGDSAVYDVTSNSHNRSKIIKKTTPSTASSKPVVINHAPDHRAELAKQTVCEVYDWQTPFVHYIIRAPRCS